MAVQSHSIRITNIVVHKFGSLKSGFSTIPDKVNSINILPQAHEVVIYESIFNPVIKCEIAVIDFIGLFVNFPLTGEEIITVEYDNIGDESDGVQFTRSWTFAIDSITDITPAPNNRSISFMINCVSIEALANVLGTVQQGYRDSPIRIAEQIFQEHIRDRIKEFHPSYFNPPLFVEDNSAPEVVRVIPNMHPIAAIDMVNELADTEVSDRYSYLFYQTSDRFNFRTMQSLIDNEAAKNFAWINRYKYFSDEISDRETKMKNETRVISNLTFNRRLSSMQKIAAGYFSNNLFEINIAQKAIHTTRTHVDDIVTLDSNKLNTVEYSEWAKSFDDGDEKSNRTKYSLTTRPEHDNDYPVIRTGRTVWGRDLSSKIALAQIDLNVAIPGTNRFVAGDLFYLEIPEFHGFEDLKQDDFVSGYYLITEIKQIITMGGYQTTVMRLNKDSYRSAIDRSSRYTN